MIGGEEVLIVSKQSLYDLLYTKKQCFSTLGL